MGVVKDGVRIRASDTKGVDGYPASSCGRPRHGTGGESQVPFLSRDLGIDLLQISVGRHDAVLENQDCLDDAGEVLASGSNAVLP